MALAAAAAVTERITLGSYVANAGVWEPLALASQIATLDVVSGGRALLVGGSGRRVLQYAAEHADVVGLSGLGRTLADGHRHEVRWAEREVDAAIEHVRRAAGAAGRHPKLEALVQYVQLTEDAEAADATAGQLADRVTGLTGEQVLGAPFAWVGTADAIADELGAHHRRWGIERYVVREAAIDDAAAVLTRLRA